LVVVKKKKGESDDKLISRFRKKVVRSGILQEARDKEHFKSDSERKQEKLKKKAFQIELEKRRTY
jgi:ribosomal protein S21